MAILQWCGVDGAIEMMRMKHIFIRNRDRLNQCAAGTHLQSGNILFTLFAAIGMVGLVGVGAMNAVKGPAQLINQVTQQSIVENELVANGRLAVMSIKHLPNGGDCDADGVPEVAAWITAPPGVPHPAGGGLIPSDLGGSRLDAWKTTYGYCVWDHGTARLSGACPSDNRLEGGESGSGLLVAIISAGPDKIFQTTCANAAGGYVVRNATSDDIVLVHSLADAGAMGEDLWKLKTANNNVAEIDKSLEIVDAGGSVTASIDRDTGVGEFKELVTETISGKSGAPVEISGALQLAGEALVTDGVCGPATAGTLRYHSVNGTEVCNGTAFIPVGGGGGGGSGGIGLYEGKITAGELHSCGLRADGAAYCWGTGANGRLGNNSTANSTTPVLVSGGHKFVQIDAGTTHTCAIRTDGAAYCWGLNSNNQLGDGTATQRLIPTAVSGGHKFVKISSGRGYTCGIRNDGAGMCWGEEGQGKLGTQEYSATNVPGVVLNNHKFIDIYAGFGHTCGIRADNELYCWGHNIFAFGEPDRIPPVYNSREPYRSGGTEKYTHIAIGDIASCALRTNGKAYCWGEDGGRLGDGTTNASSVPVPVTGDNTFISLTAGKDHFCGVRTDGVAYCWGAADESLGSETGGWSSSARPVAGGGKFTALTAGRDHTCGIRTDGSVYCWGLNTTGAIGDGSTTTRPIPTHVPTFSMLDVQNRPYKFAQDEIACVAGREGTVQYHATNGLQVCNGTTYVAAATFENKMFSDSGLYDGRLAVGYDQSCALRNDGAAYCWGENGSGQLGDGTLVGKQTPVPVTGGHQFVQIEGGDEHTCALRADGAAYCWGSNAYGQLGDGTTTTRSSPTLVTGGHKFTYIDAGEAHTCGLRTDGAAYCWGWNTGGSLGDGTTTNRSSPRLVLGGHKFVKLKVGQSVTCGLLLDGTAYCWGYNDGGIGDGTTNNASTPVLVSGGHKFAFIHPGMEHSCGIRLDGAAMCWGRNADGKLGDGTTVEKFVPTLVSGNHKFRQILADTWHSCGIRADGVAMCWGANSNGALGDGTTVRKLVPTVVNGGGDYAQISLGGYHTCGLKASGMILCWGANWSGQIGDGTTTARSTPTVLAGLSLMDMQQRSFQFANDASTCAAHMDGTMRYVGGTTKYEYCNGTAWGPLPSAGGVPWKSVSAGGMTTCALRADGAAYCWGYNMFGHLGDGTTTYKYKPTAVIGGHIFSQIEAGGGTTCALKDNGAAYCWGPNGSGQVGDGTTTQRTSPTAVSGGHRFAQITVGSYSACGLKDNGEAYCWGQNLNRELGDGTTVSKSIPTPVSGGHLFAKLQSGQSFTCGIKDNGTAWCWGAGGMGQLGDGAASSSAIPVAVSDNHLFTQIGGRGGSSSCGLKDNGAAYCWGYNGAGQIGDGTTTNRYTPRAVSGSHIFTEIAVGAYGNACGIKNDGVTYCWGDGAYGVIGDGTTTSRSAPRIVIGGHVFKKISLGGDSGSGGGHACGLKENGDLYCWGYNGYGEVGDGTNTQRNEPVKVSAP